MNTPVEMPENSALEQHKQGACCLNCGAALRGCYCSNCGQRSATRIVSLRQFFNDFFGDYFTFDSRLARSLTPLIVRPGLLTNEYLAGRRMRYIPPLRLYLFISLVFFFLLSTMSLRPTWFGHHHDEGAVRSAKIEVTAKQKAALARKPSWDQRVARNALALKSHPRAFFRNVIHKVPTVMFVLLPLFALMLKILYWRRRRYYVEHLIFSCHYHALVFFTLIVGLLVYAIAVAFDLSVIIDNISRVLWIYLLVYLALAMRRVYGQGWLKSLIKLGALTCTYGLALALSLMATLTWVLVY